MSPKVTEAGAVSDVARWLSGFWDYYREYTHTAIHAAAAAALTAFGLLIFVDRLFAVVAIAAYVCPPLVLYAIGSDRGTPTDGGHETSARTDVATTPDGAGPRDSDTDTDSDDGDADGVDGDTDSDDGDTDSDSDDGDTDTDSDDGDSDADADG